MELKRKNLCPMLDAECRQLDCAWFMKLGGTDPQDKDRVIEEWGCAITFQVLATLEVAKRTGGGLDGVQKATESFRNEMVEANRMGLSALVRAAQLNNHAPPHEDLPVETPLRIGRQY